MIVTAHIPPLVAQFLHEASGDTKRIAPDARDYLLKQFWSGNIRELRNVIEHAVVISEDQEIQLPEIQWCLSQSLDGDPSLPHHQILRNWGTC